MGSADDLRDKIVKGMKTDYAQKQAEDLFKLVNDDEFRLQQLEKNSQECVDCGMPILEKKNGR